jgi:hypothetical protein
MFGLLITNALYPINASRSLSFRKTGPSLAYAWPLAARASTARVDGLTGKRPRQS